MKKTLVILMTLIGLTSFSQTLPFGFNVNIQSNKILTPYKNTMVYDTTDNYNMITFVQLTYQTKSDMRVHTVVYGVNEYLRWKSVDTIVVLKQNQHYEDKNVIIDYYPIGNLTITNENGHSNLNIGVDSDEIMGFNLTIFMENKETNTTVTWKGLSNYVSCDPQFKFQGSYNVLFLSCVPY